MNKERLVERVQQINAELTQCRANYASLEGHLSECTHWLQEIERQEMQDNDDAEMIEANKECGK